MRPIQSARVVWQTLGTMKVTYVSYNRGTAGLQEQEQASRNVEAMLAETRAQLPAAIENALRSRGIPEGDDATIFLVPDEATNLAHGAAGTMRMTVQFKDATAPGLWTVKIKATRSVIDTDRTVAAKFVAKALQELESAGMLGAKR